MNVSAIGLWHKIRSLIYTSLLLTIVACAPLKKEVNRRYPPLNLNMATEEASKDALASLQKLERADMYIGISDDDLKSLAPGAIATADSRIKALQLGLANQALLFNVKFDGAFPEAGFSAAGEIAIAAVPVIDGLVLRVRPVAQHVKLTNLKVRKKGPLDGLDISAAAPIITRVLNEYLDNINGQIKAYSTKLDFATSMDLKATDILKELPGATNFQGTPYRVIAAMELGTILVDKQGLHALVQSKLTRQNIDPTDPSLRSQNKSAQTAYDSFSAAFRDFSRAHIGSDIDARWGSTAAAASNKFVGAILNTAAQPIGFSADYTIPSMRGNFNELLEVRTNWDLDCSYSGMDCSFSDIHCNDQRNCNPGWDCPSCKWYQVDCHARKVLCEADKVRWRAQCEIERAASNAICTADKLGRIAACEVEKVARKLGCEINKKWLQMVDGADIGRLKGDYRIADVKGNVLLNGGTVSENLDSIAIDFTLAARSNVSVSADFQPYGLGYIACIGPVNLNLNTGIGFKPQKLDLSATKVASKFEDDVLKMTYRTAGRKVTISTDEPPMLKLTLENPDFLVKCTPVAVGVTVGALFKKFREDLLRTDYEIDVDPFQFDIGIPSFAVPVFDNKVTFTPYQSASALWFDGKLQ